MFLATMEQALGHLKTWPQKVIVNVLHFHISNQVSSFVAFCLHG